MNVNAVGPSDEHDIRKAAVEAAMLTKEPTPQERVEAQQKLLNNFFSTEDHGMLRDAIKPADLAALFVQIKSQADRIAELEAKLPSADTYRAVMDERANLAQRVAELESERGKCQTCGAPISRDCSKCSANERKE